MRTISASVGQGGTNTKPDATTVQELLNQVPVDEGGPQIPLKVDGLAWGKTIAAIKRFQSVNLGHKWPDGRVDPGGKTLARLNDYDTPAPSPEPPPPTPPPAKQFVYMVPGKKVVIGQPTMYTCWATVYTMMRCWREGKKFEIAEALEKPGKQYVDLFKQNRGLLPSQFRDFWTRGGLTVRGYATFPDYIWYDFLRKHGLLAVGEASSLPPVTGLHLRVMEGMSVRDAPNDCYYIIDPGWGGKQYPERTFDFEAKYNLAMSFGGGANWQVAHYY
jgi:hypothetical protein